MIGFSQEILTIILAAGLGGLIGLEREKSHRPAGLRTHMIVCTGACLLTIVSMSVFGQDSHRIIQGIVTGLGFLGAGSIIASGTHVQGVTTAATIWVTAILGITVALGYYLLAVVTTGIILLLLLVKNVEKKI